jgi:hypothetical protein
MTSNVKQAWFDVGADALARLIPDVPRGYGCPLCLRSFPPSRSDDLTIEHVPPRSLGGTPTLLTCVECNSRAGGPDGVDTHARCAENVFDFALGAMESGHQAKLTIGGVSQNIRVSTSGPIRMLGVPEADPPGTADRMQAAFEESSSATSDPTLRITLFRDTFSPRRQAISWLRSAYLAAFSAFGYRYILRSSLNDVRQQIHNPDAHILKAFSLFTRKAPPDARYIGLTYDPEWLCALTIQIGRHVVFLPYFNGDFTLYERVQNDRFNSNELHFQARLLAEWPSRPMLVCDTV